MEECLKYNTIYIKFRNKMYFHLHIGHWSSMEAFIGIINKMFMLFFIWEVE